MKGSERYLALGAELRSVREKAGLRQGDLAAKLGVSRPAVSGYEGGWRRPDLDTLFGWANACGVTIHVAFGGPPTDRPVVEPLFTALRARPLDPKTAAIVSALEAAVLS